MNEFTVGDLSRRSRQHQDSAARRWRLMRQSVLGVVLVVACQSALSQALYRIKSLGYLGGCTSFTPVANGFNATDQVTGQACNAAGDLHAFLWKNNGTAMIDLGPSEAGSTSRVTLSMRTDWWRDRRRTAPAIMGSYRPGTVRP